MNTTDPVPFLRGCEHVLFHAAADEIERLREQVRAATLTDDRIDAAIDAVLKAAGSSLKNYTLPGTLNAMREAMRAATREEEE